MTFPWRSPGSRPLVIAHRGGAALAGENTAAAFAAAVAAGADAVETDVRVTADGALVCVHDADLLRLAGDVRSVAALDLATLRAVLPGLLTLAEAIAASAPLGLLLDVKLKDTRVLPGILGAVDTQDAGGRVLLGLRDTALIVAARALTDLPVLAFAADPDGAAAARGAGADWFRLWQGDLSGERVAAVRAAGLRLAVMVGQPRAEPLPGYPPFPVGHVDGDGLARIAQCAPDAVLLDDPRLLKVGTPSTARHAPVVSPG